MVQQDLLKRFEQYLIDGGFHPGDRLPVEQELAAYFGVARSTIREIIIHLSLQGVLERKPHRGTILAAPTVESIGADLTFRLHWLGCGKEELKSTRLMLEQTVAAEVIRCITPAQLDRLDRVNAEMKARADAPIEADAFDLQFHLTLLEIAGSRLMQVFAQVITLLFDREYRYPRLSPASIRDSADFHGKMIQSIRDRDLARLRQQIYDHITPL